MADGDELGQGGAPAPVPTSLSADAAQAKAGLEALMGDRESAYWRGSEEAPASSFQAFYADLVRGELQGATDAVGVPHGPDADLPLHVGGYDIASIPGAGALDARGRDLIDLFLPAALERGLGQRKVAAAIGYILNGGGTIADFDAIAHGAGWSQKAIDFCVEFYRQACEPGGIKIEMRDDAGRFTGAPTRSEIAARKAEIESQMYLDGGLPNPAYFSGPLGLEYRTLLQMELKA